MALDNLNRQNYRTFAPVLSLTERRRFRFVKVDRPLFPGYLFIYLNLAQEAWRPIQNTKGVIRILTATGGFLSVPAGLIESLLDRTDESGKIMSMDDVDVDVEVRIKTGHLPVLMHVSTVWKDERVYLLLNTGVEKRINTDIDNLLPLGTYADT